MTWLTKNLTISSDCEDFVDSDANWSVQTLRLNAVSQYLPYPSSYQHPAHVLLGACQLQRAEDEGWPGLSLQLGMSE